MLSIQLPATFLVTPKIYPDTQGLGTFHSPSTRMVHLHHAGVFTY